MIDRDLEIDFSNFIMEDHGAMLNKADFVDVYTSDAREHS